jgi:pimeloyl-ACP methyl ester carboxylesterase
MRHSTLSDEDKIKALAGSRLNDIKRDVAFGPVAATILREDAANGGGELNDARRIFLSKSAYCRWESIKARTLIIHDRQDTFVPLIHAAEAGKRIRHAELRSYQLGGHILWLGRDARRMHSARLQFLKGSQ